MTRARRKRGPSLLRRLIYFAIVLSGGGAGGYAFQNNSLVRSLLNVVTGQPADKVLATLDDSLVKDVVNVIKPADATGAPGLYEVAITKVELDQKLFRPGHTVDIQARVRRLGPAGRETTLWESKEFGSRLAVVGKDDLTAGWPDRPFQVAWNAGDQLVLEVYDARLGLFIPPRRFTLDTAGSSPTEFPLKSGDFGLVSAQSSDGPVNPRTNHVVVRSERLGGLRSADRPATEVAERPIVIK